ncbi:MAG: hypothetical protein E7124_06315 [Bacteroidales bacterium]|nr:hypothetical protein [Bacteroidales bacterium]
MRKIIYLTLFIFVLSCTKEMRENPSENHDMKQGSLHTKAGSDSLDAYYSTMKDNFPDSIKQLITLSNGLVVEKVGDFYVFESDMIFTDSTLCYLEGIQTNGARSAVIDLPAQYWPQRKVPYEFDSSFIYDYQTKALQAMSSISSVTGVRFVPAESYHTSRIRFKLSQKNNSSPLGMQGGTQTIYIKTNSHGVMMHEILHSLGIYHEQSRADRDSYIIINTSNIKNDKLHNFSKYSTGTDIGTFDYNSIMMYGSFTTDTDFVHDINVPMITKLDGSFISENRLYLSNGDIMGIRSIYGPPYHKLVISQDVFEDYNDMETEIFDAEKTYTIKFYSDEACTISAPLVHPRKIKLRRYETYCDSNHQVHEGYNDIIVTVPAGVTEYILETYDHYERYIQSIPYDVNTVRYVIANTH